MTIDEIKAKATEYIKERGLSIITIREDKRPALNEWKTLQKKAIENPEDLFTGKLVNPKITIYGIGVITGSVNGNLEVIDIDTKNDIKGGIWEALKEGIAKSLPTLLDQFLIVQTKSGGYHIYYRSEAIEGNLKLANNPKGGAILETRGEGGYVVAPPTPDYKIIQGNYDSIPDITIEERDTLLSICRSLDQFIRLESKTTPATTYSTAIVNIEDSPLEAYNRAGASVVIPLLVSHGWKEVEKSGDRIKVLRPGESTAPSSGDFHIGKNLLKIFSSSTDFEPLKGYSPSSVFCLLECGGDWKKAYRELLALGYGKPFIKERASLDILSTQKISVTSVNNVSTKVITAPGEILLKESIEDSKGDIYIDSPEGSEEETLKAIAITEAIGKRAYVKTENGDILKTYHYKYEVTFNKYLQIEKEGDGLTAPQEDQFLEELVYIASTLKGVDRDLYISFLLKNKHIVDLGLTRERIEETAEKIRELENKREIHKKTEELTRKAQELIDQNKTEEAIKLLEEGTSKLSKLKSKDFVSEILKATSREDILEEIKNAPEGLRSGYYLGKIKNGNLTFPEEWIITAGGLTAIAGATNHGKTDFLINTCLQVSKNYPGKKFFYLTYEQTRRDIFLRFLNSFCDIDITDETNRRSNIRAIKDCYKDPKKSSTQIEIFKTKEIEFYTKYVDTQRLIIKQIDYNSEDINSTIEQLCKQDSSIGGFFIDYYQKLELPTEERKKEGGRVEELKTIGKRLNALCINTGIPIILGAQFNRKVMSSEDMFSQNIGEAGDIERILDTLIAIWNTSKKLRKHESEETYNLVEKGIAEEVDTGEKDKKGKAIKKLIGIPGKLYVEVLKSRDTETGLEALLEYNGKLGNIKNQKNNKSNF